MPQSFLHVFVIVFSFFAVFAAPVFAAGTDDGSAAASATAPDYAAARALVEAGNYDAALPALLAVTEADAQNADAWNLLGFTHRMLGHMEDSSLAYLNVLSINPDHLGALEYQGELFLQTGKPDAAKANLARIKALCGSCEESLDLEKAITAAGV